MTIYVPETGGTSLTSLIGLVRRRLGDFPQKRRQVETGDGVTVNFRLTDSPYEADGATATVDGMAIMAVTTDYDASWLSFTSPADIAAEIVLNYSTVAWSDERITEAINSAIDELFGRFYVKSFNDAIYSDGGAELTVQTSAGNDLGPEDRITRVQFWSGSRWVRADRWRVESQGDTKVIIFEQNPSAGLRLRVHYIVRPGNLVGASDTLETVAGLPTRAKEPVILLTCSGLIVERMHHRIRDDRGHNTQADNQVKSYEIQNDAQFLRAQAELLMARLKMDSLTARVVS